jgi:hypothetical protein
VAARPGRLSYQPLVNPTESLFWGVGKFWIFWRHSKRFGKGDNKRGLPPVDPWPVEVENRRETKGASFSRSHVLTPFRLALTATVRELPDKRGKARCK